MVVKAVEHGESLHFSFCASFMKDKLKYWQLPSPSLSVSTKHDHTDFDICRALGIAN